VTLLETFHDGSLPASTGFVDVEPAGVVVSVVKRAEDGDDLIVRAYEAHGRRAAATIRFPNWERTIETDFAPFEIRTFRVPRDPAAAVTETDLLEEPA
jgi:alpha-mannosidase